QVWSAACSTGEEPYTLAMVLSEFSEKNPGYDFRILGTDLSTKVLEHAIRAIYAERRVDPIELSLRKKYLLRSRNPQAGAVRIIPELRDVVRFQRLNFLEDPYPKDQCMDVIFCRNVLIYFDRETQQEIVGKMCATLRPGGYLFVGHSETLNGLNLPVRLVQSTLYRKI
ncbi:MAG: methyltransferase domain-containing protein, partial [Pontiellaceae bacterium]|nr:methyltransferase domain-containing protein [Pontiellaceae bacterium]